MVQAAAQSPEPLEVSAPRLQANGGSFVLSATLRLGDRRWEVDFRSDAELACSWEPFLVLALPAAMHLGRPLVVPGEVSPLLLARLPELQSTWAAGEPSVRPVEVLAPPGSPPRLAAGRASALFFSGGVDSFHSLLELDADLSALVFVDGFDLHPHQRDLYARALASVREVAASFGKRLICVQTNLRAFADELGDWGIHFHGPAKAAVALALAPAVRRCHFSGERLLPGNRDCSRLELDPLWSTEQVEILHVGHDVTRFDKLRRIAPDPRVRGHLRVCWENRGGRYNCGECSKCIRNMAALRALGWLDSVATFDRPLKPREVRRRLGITGISSRTGVEDIVGHLRVTGRDPELLRVLERILARHAWEVRHPRAHRAAQHCRAFPGRALRKLWRLLHTARRSIAPPAEGNPHVGA